MLLEGESGVGKSRLIREFLEEHEGDARTLVGRCLSYGQGITFWPVAEVVRMAAGIEEDDAPEAAYDRIRDLLDEVYRVFSEDHLLALRPPDLLVELQTWYFTEFERQGRGEDPVPWAGPTSMPPA